jgi:hypothetical protein
VPAEPATRTRPAPDDDPDALRQACRDWLRRLVEQGERAGGEVRKEQKRPAT